MTGYLRSRYLRTMSFRSSRGALQPSSTCATNSRRRRRLRIFALHPERAIQARTKHPCSFPGSQGTPLEQWPWVTSSWASERSAVRVLENPLPSRKEAMARTRAAVTWGELLLFSSLFFLLFLDLSASAALSLRAALPSSMTWRGTKEIREDVLTRPTSPGGSQSMGHEANARRGVGSHAPLA